MRDIVYRKTERVTTATEQAPNPVPVFRDPAPKKIQQSQGLYRALRNLAGLLNRAGGLLLQAGEQEHFTVITPTHSQNPHVGTTPQSVRPFRTRKSLKLTAPRSVKTIAGKTKNQAKKVSASLKTPVGKLAAIHSLAILALLGYVVYNNQSELLSLAHNGTALEVRAGIRQYLPIAGKVTAPPTSNVTHADVESARTVPLNAWVTPWNSDELQENAVNYRTLSAFWLTLQPNGYDVLPKADWKIWDTFQANSQVSGQKRYLTVSAHPNDSFITLSDSTAQQKHIAILLQTVKQHNFDGIDIDYEGLGFENRDLFTNFIRALSAAFDRENKDVAVTVEARLANQVPMDWRNLGLIADEVRIMAYDYHSRTTNFPGAIAPLGWVKEIVEYATSNIDPKKIVIGLGNYGYNWTQNPDNPGNWEGIGLSHDQAVKLAEEKQVSITQATGIDDRGYDLGSIPNFNYSDDQGKAHSVWFEDQQSLQSKINLISQYPVQGVIFWSVGLGDPDFWAATNNVNEGI